MVVLDCGSRKIDFAKNDVHKCISKLFKLTVYSTTSDNAPPTSSQNLPTLYLNFAMILFRSQIQKIAQTQRSACLSSIPAMTLKKLSVPLQNRIYLTMSHTKQFHIAGTMRRRSPAMGKLCQYQNPLLEPSVQYD